MTPISRIISHFESLTKLPEARPLLQEVRVVFLSPTLHIDLISDSFRGFNEEDRMLQVKTALTESFSEKASLMQDVMSRLPVTISPLTTDEAKNKASWLGAATTSSWVNWFLHNKPSIERRSIPATPRYVHFYGYKGGQARSSILGLFGKLLADDGYRILVIDADTEAPSLDSLFGAHADHFSQTLMGLCGWASEFSPIPAAYTGQLGTGRIDVLPCRPKNEDHDLDFALLVATAPLDTRIYERAAAKLQLALSALDDPYDFVLVDHRTGIATSVLPLVVELPGPTVVFARTDSNTVSIPSEMRKVVRSIFESSGDNPGAFVSFSLDSTRKAESTVPTYEARAREELLAELAESMEYKGASPNHDDEEEEEEEEAVSPQELAFNWVDWYLDRALLDTTLPDISKLQSDNISALQKLRGILGLPIQKRASVQRDPKPQSGPATLSVSGARDKGTFIHIPDIERLFTKGSPLTYILGRKGTGKTRLLKELALRGLGIPVLVAADEVDFPALRSQSAEAQEWVNRSDDPGAFWWSLIRLAIQDQNGLPEAITRALAAGQNPADLSSPLEIKSLLVQSIDQRVLLIDGLETLVPAAKIKAYVAGIFAVMNMIQNDPVLSSKLVVRVFLREDLASDSVQNIEQQMEGRVLRLKWSATSILNFALSRLPLLPWISKNFPYVSNEIENRSDEIQQSAMSEQEATEMLLRVFPDRLRRNNLLTSTFLRLYFSDAGGDNTNLATFYPRLYLSFLQKLDDLAKADDNPLSDDGRLLNSALLNRAYDQASSAFIDETKQELVHLLSLNFVSQVDASGNDQSNVTQFVAAFDGLSTPFAIDKLVSQLQEKTPFTDQSIRESLRRMKALRMFEDRPGYSGWWRVGQLYKMGLRMKYARSNAKRD
jgi:Mrp family chromosome partitioning ATPase